MSNPTGLRGERLKTTREMRGYSQETLADMVGVKYQQIWRWESGDQDVRGYSLVRLAQALNVTSDYLLGLSDDPLPYSDRGDLPPEVRELLVAYDSGEIMELIFKFAQKAMADKFHQTGISGEKPAIES